MLDILEVKEFLKIDYDDEDKYLLLLSEGASYFIEDIVDEYEVKMKNSKFKTKAKILMLAIINDCYESRKLVSDKKEELRFTMSAFIRQLQYCKYN